MKKPKITMTRRVSVSISLLCLILNMFTLFLCTWAGSAHLAWTSFVAAFLSAVTFMYLTRNS